jgi:hypothetical protein
VLRSTNDACKTANIVVLRRRKGDAFLKRSVIIILTSAFYFSVRRRTPQCIGKTIMYRCQFLSLTPFLNLKFSTKRAIITAELLLDTFTRVVETQIMDEI